MTWRYVQRTGALYRTYGAIAGVGYSGHGDGLNNPDWQDRVGVGPIPRGDYTIGPAHSPIDHLGPMAFPLIPDAANEMHGRSGFFMHGDNIAMNHTASNGCVILRPSIRHHISITDDDRLRVVAEESDL